jgi:inosine-uridine nucleoside N-ribohydrolase
MLASALCKVAGKNVPVYPGTEKPLLVKQNQPFVPQAKALERWNHDKDFPRNEAIEFLRKTIRKNPGEVTLLAIGPLTNIGLLFSIDPEIPGLLKQLVLMGGVFTSCIANLPHAEWNILCDPHAAAIVYNAPVKIHKSIGLDVTCQVTMDKDEVKNRFKADILKPVYDFAKVWFEGRPEITFHDPLAAATIFDDGICTFEKGNIEVELLSERVKGMTHWKADSENGIHQAALKVDKERFFNHYFGTVNR